MVVTVKIGNNERTLERWKEDTEMARPNLQRRSRSVYELPTFFVSVYLATDREP